MEKHTYYWKNALGFFTGMLAAVAITLNVMGVGDFKTSPTTIRLAVFFHPILIFIGILNIYPDISTDKDCIYLHGAILRKRLQIPLNNVKYYELSLLGTNIVLMRILNSNIISLFPIILYGYFLVHPSISNYCKIKNYIDTIN